MSAIFKRIIIFQIVLQYAKSPDDKSNFVQVSGVSSFATVQPKNLPAPAV